MSKRCIICGLDDPVLVRDLHHAFGRANDKKSTVALCANHHLLITAIQNKFPRYAKKKDAMMLLKKLYAIRSFAAMLSVWGDETVKFTDELLEEYKKCKT